MGGALLLPTLIGFPPTGPVKGRPVSGGVSKRSLTRNQRQIIEGPCRRIGESGVGVVNLHKISAVGFGARGVRMIQLSKAPVSRLDLQGRSVLLDSEDLVQTCRPDRFDRTSCFGESVDHGFTGLPAAERHVPVRSMFLS